MKHSLPSLLLVSFALWLSCAQEPQEREVVASKVESREIQSVDSIWHSNERIVQAALDGGPVFEDRYMEACKFFERLTNIPIRGEGSQAGWIPNKYTAEDLQAVRDWYTANRDRLYFNEETKSVEVRPPAP